jgi:hypothetical protein
MPEDKVKSKIKSNAVGESVIKSFGIGIRIKSQNQNHNKIQKSKDKSKVALDSTST